MSYQPASANAQDATNTQYQADNLITFVTRDADTGVETTDYVAGKTNILECWLEKINCVSGEAGAKPADYVAVRLPSPQSGITFIEGVDPSMYGSNDFFAGIPLEMNYAWCDDQTPQAWRQVSITGTGPKSGKGIVAAWKFVVTPTDFVKSQYIELEIPEIVPMPLPNKAQSAISFGLNGAIRPEADTNVYLLHKEPQVIKYSSPDSKSVEPVSVLFVSKPNQSNYVIEKSLDLNTWVGVSTNSSYVVKMPSLEKEFYRARIGN